MTTRHPPYLRIILLGILLEVAAAAQVQHGSESVLWQWLYSATQPLVATGQWSLQTATDLLWSFRDSRLLAAENRRLREGLALSEAESLLLREDVLALREASALPTTGLESAGRHIAARCTYRDLASGRMHVTAGVIGGVRRGNAALGAQGLVGRVITTDAHSSWIELITNPAAAVAVRTSDGSVHGLATGSGGGRLDVEFVPRTAHLVRDTILVSSGADGVYPPGIPVARVMIIRESDNPFLEVHARPLADLATLRVVLLLHRTRTGAPPS